MKTYNIDDIVLTKKGFLGKITSIIKGAKSIGYVIENCEDRQFHRHENIFGRIEQI